VDGGAVEVRELATNQVLATCTEPNLEFRGFSLRPDGKAVTAVCFPKGKPIKLGDTFTLVTWDATTGKELHRVEGWKGYGARYTPDGTKLVNLNHYENEITFADADTAKVSSRLKVHGLSGFSGIDLSKDGKRLVTCGGRDRSAIIWDLTTGKPALDFDAPRGPVCVIAFSPDGKTLFTGSTQEHAGWVWEAETGKRKQLLVADGKGNPTSAAFTSDGKSVVVGYGLGEGWANDPRSKWVARLWNVADGKVVREFSGHAGGVLNLMLSPDGKQLVTRDRSAGSVRLWDFNNGKSTKVIPWVDHLDAVLSLPKADDLVGATLVEEGGAEALSLLTGKKLGNWRKKETSKPHAISPDGRLVACRERTKGKSGEQLVIRLVAGGEVVCQLSVESVSHLSAVAFSSDGSMIAVGGVGYKTEETTHVFDSTTGTELRTLRGHQGSVSAIAFSHDGKRLATGSTDTTVLIWNLKP
jgi:WD40 repeat protein